MTVILIMQEMDKFDVKISVISNGLEKCTIFTIKKNLVFINTVQFMNSILYKLVKNLLNNDFKFLSQEFSGDLLELTKQKGMYPYEYMGSFEKLSEDKLPGKGKLFSSLKGECISGRYYLRAIINWNAFKMNRIG